MKEAVFIREALVGMEINTHTHRPHKETGDTGGERLEPEET